MGDTGRVAWERAVPDGGDGLELEYAVRGAGEPVVFLHNGALIDGFRPLLGESVLADRYRLVSYYRAGDRAGAVDLFLQGTCGPDYRAPLERAVPGAVDQAVADAPTFFEQELPALREWAFGPEEARRVRPPVLAVVGEKSGPVHRQRWDLLRAWLPQAESFALPGAGHLLHLQQPRAMAEALAAFFGRHPLAT